MKHRLYAGFLTAALLLCLAGCGEIVEPPAPSAPPTPEPTPTVTLPPDDLVLTGSESGEEILSLADFDNLRSVDGSASTEYEALMKLRQALPDCRVTWTVPLGGRDYPDDTEELTLTADGELEELELALPYLPALKKVDMLQTGVTPQQVDRYLALREDVDYLWWVAFSDHVVRSDITCFSTLLNGVEYRNTDEDLYPLLHYCRHLRALDIGHNGVTDRSVEEIGKLKELQVLILVDNNDLRNPSALAELPELWYLEIFCNYDLEEFGWLWECEKIEDINIAYALKLDTLEWAAHMPNLHRCWIRSTKISVTDWREYREKYPDVQFYIHAPAEDVSALSGGWRNDERNQAIRNAFKNWTSVVEFQSWDNVIYGEEGIMGS